MEKTGELKRGQRGQTVQRVIAISIKMLEKENENVSKQLLELLKILFSNYMLESISLV